MTKLDKLELLNNLSDGFPSDKKEHGYLPYYSQHLPETCRMMLEIGAAKGMSALIWDAFYNKEVDLHLLDLFLDENHVSTRWVRDHGWVPLMGDQSNITFLASIPYKYQVIIDDGSHRADHMLISFKALFMNNTVQGATYFIEDAHCNKNDFYWGGFVKSFHDTPLNMFRHLKETGLIVNSYFNEGEAHVFQNLIKSVDIVADDKLIIIKRK